jgi:hypothetical protein
MFNGLAMLCLVVISLFIFAGIWLDRRGTWWAWKWAGTAALFAYVYYISNLPYNFDAVLGVLTSAAFWKPVGTFIGVGLLYTVVEFLAGNYRMARKIAALWQSFLSSRLSLRLPGQQHSSTDLSFLQFADPSYAAKAAAVDADLATTKSLIAKLGKQVYVPLAELGGENAQASEELAGLITKYGWNYSYVGRLDEGHYVGDYNDQLKERLGDFVGSVRFYADYIDLNIVTSSAPPTLEPSVNKLRLGKSICAWALLWPFYAIHLLLGDLLQHVADALASLFAKFGSRFVKLAFAGVFDMKTS